MYNKTFAQQMTLSADSIRRSAKEADPVPQPQKGYFDPKSFGTGLGESLLVGAANNKMVDHKQMMAARIAAKR